MEHEDSVPYSQKATTRARTKPDTSCPYSYIILVKHTLQSIKYAQPNKVM